MFAVAIGIVAAYYVNKLGKVLKGAADGILTLPMVLPPTVVGFCLLVVVGSRGPAGQFFESVFHTKIVFSCYAPISPHLVAGRSCTAQCAARSSSSHRRSTIGETLGLKNTFIFWRIITPMPAQCDRRDGARVRRGLGSSARQSCSRQHPRPDDDNLRGRYSAMAPQQHVGSVVLIDLAISIAMMIS